jgi:hypothetical protein
VPTFIGFATYKNKKSGEEELMVGKAARAWVYVNGGRILSIYYMETGEPNVLIAFEGRGLDQATKCFKDLETQQGLTVKMIRGFTEGEKERANIGKAWVS